VAQAAVRQPGVEQQEAERLQVSDLRPVVEPLQGEERRPGVEQQRVEVLQQEVEQLQEQGQQQVAAEAGSSGLLDRL